MGVLDDPKVQAVLKREYENSRADAGRMEGLREKLDQAMREGTYNYDLYPKDVYLAIEPDMGQFLYITAKLLKAQTIVEFGTSFGISTIYLAAAARETGGRVIGSEFEASKAEKAYANLKEAGLDDLVDIRVGDGLETLADIEKPVDFLFLDAWKDLYVPMAKMMEPKLQQGSIVAADNIFTFPEELREFVEHMSRADGPYDTVTVPFESGLLYSLYTG